MRERVMANEKNPSIYVDRGTIGSSTELDEYGVWVKSEPQDLSSTGAEAVDFGDDLVPEEAADFPAAPEDLPDFGESGGDSPGEDLDFDIPLEIATEEEMDDFFEDPSGNTADFALDEAFGDGEPSPDSDIAGTGVLDVSPDFDNPEKESPPEGAGKTGSGVELSTQLLMRIVGELSSIKDELSTLKRELSAIHNEPREAAAPGATGRGFFDEGEDEKIALTGDEMDNILHTADFTDETGADAADHTGGAGDFAVEDEETLDLPVSEELPGEESPEINLSGDLLDFAVEEPLEEPLTEETLPGETMELAEEEITLEDGLGFEAPPEDTEPEPESEEPAEEPPAEESLTEPEPAAEEISLSPEDTLSIEDALGKDIELLGDEVSLDLQELQQTGVEPMTPAPEDISYLETEPEAFDDISLDLSDPVGDETGEGTGEPEPPVETLTVDLDLDESLPEEEALAVFDESAPEEEDEEILIDLPLDGITEAIPDAEFEEVPPPDLPDSSEEETPEDAFGAPEEEPGEPFEQLIPEGFEEETGGEAPPEETLGDFEESFAGLPELPEDTLTEEDLGEEPKTDAGETADIPANLKRDLKSVLAYMDQLLESLPEEKIEEFAKSEYFDTYKKVFEELGIS
jgi:hypothetical protein